MIVGDVHTQTVRSWCPAKHVSPLQEGKHFQVIVVDARPQLEGQQLLRRLLRAGISCSYTLINALYYIMAEASKVGGVN